MFPCNIVNGKHLTFNSSEQAYMLEKALYATESDVATQISEATNGFQAKRIAKNIPHQKLRFWLTGDMESPAAQAMYNACELKFRQNGQLRTFLLGTKDLYLLEDNPHDYIWGAGKKSVNNNAVSWKGGNLLGRTLMKLRDSLLEEDREKFKKQKQKHIICPYGFYVKFQFVYERTVRDISKTRH